jgi:hypothetical protein
MTKQQRTAPSDSSKQLLALEPKTPDQLHRFVQVVLGMTIPKAPLVPGSSAPFDYLLHTFFENTPQTTTATSKDAVVWANRGGGKTMLGAIATLLDLLFKPGIQVRILGGSLEQSSKMFEHLIALLDRPWFQTLLDGEPTQRRVALSNGSQAQLLAGSQRSVRGVRVQKLRCDEVEEFEPGVWDAAQMVTRSSSCGGKHVQGAVEALSTMHRPFGLMAKLTDAYKNNEPGAARLFKWTAMDVIEKCSKDRPCDRCVLWDDCKGLAKSAIGFIPVDDLIQQWHRTSRHTWSVEMMCRKPQVSDCVYPEFDPKIHVLEDNPEHHAWDWIGSMDFGLRNPTVMLWARIDTEAQASSQAPIHIVDEYIRAGITFDQHINAINRQASMHGWPRTQWLGVDPAGNQRNSHTGISDVQALRKLGHTVKTRRSSLRDGIERIRRRLDHNTLRIHPRCKKLIEAMRCYHFDVTNPQRQDPIKDGPDHLCDALRYMVINLEAGSENLTATSYL